MIVTAQGYIREALWSIPEHSLPAYKKLLIRITRIIVLSIRGFTDDLCRLRASALTLYTLLSIVPVIAMLFGIAKGFGFEKMLQKQLLEQIPEQDTMMLRLFEFAENMLASTQGGVVAGIGIAVLFWTIIKVIGNIETSFNAIWKIKESRSFSRKLSDYLSLMLLAPVLLITSSSITVFVKTQITWLITVIQLPELGVWLVLKSLSYSPLIIMSVLFSFLFIFMPNEKISYKAGIIAGVVTGLMYQILQWGYLSLQIGVTGYNAIYGSFAALPLFILWLQAGWIIVLFGCELAYFIQNYENYKDNNKYADLSIAVQRNVALKLMHIMTQQFYQAAPAITVEEMANKLLLPSAVVHSVLAQLIQCHLVIEIKTEEGHEALFQMGVAPEQLTVKSVVEMLDKEGNNTLLESGVISQFEQLLKNKTENCLLRELQESK